jgi:GTP-binding protein
VIAANKIDCLPPDAEEDPVQRLRDEFESRGTPVYPISAVTGSGVRELLLGVKEMLDRTGSETVTFRQEFFPEEILIRENLPFTVERLPENPPVYVVEGPKIEKMLGYTNLESEKGFRFFQNFLKDTGILKELEKLGIEDGDTVQLYELQFEYFK